MPEGPSQVLNRPGSTLAKLQTSKSRKTSSTKPQTPSSNQRRNGGPPTTGRARLPPAPNIFPMIAWTRRFGLGRRLQPLKKSFIVPMNCRRFAGTAALPGDAASYSPILSTVLPRGVRDARRSRPEACSTLDRIGAACARVGSASRRSILASRQNHVRRRMAHPKTPRLQKPTTAPRNSPELHWWRRPPVSRWSLEFEEFGFWSLKFLKRSSRAIRLAVIKG
jgi:hypothetical protein